MEYYTAIKMSKIMPFAATWMDLEIIILNEVSQTNAKDKYHDINSLWNLKLTEVFLSTIYGKYTCQDP